LIDLMVGNWRAALDVALDCIVGYRRWVTEDGEEEGTVKIKAPRKGQPSLYAT
jgi:hypothetical protein